MGIEEVVDKGQEKDGLLMIEILRDREP